MALKAVQRSFARDGRDAGAGSGALPFPVVGIMRHDDQNLSRQLAWCRNIIERQVVQMTHLLEDLLDVSRVTCNKIELRRDRIDLLRAVEQALETTRPVFDAQGQRLQLDLPSEPLVVHGDLTRLTQVFGNLLNNAAKYTDAGGVLALSAAREGDRVRVSVRGIGIEAQQLGRVFDMFSQLAPALERARGRPGHRAGADTWPGRAAWWHH